MWRNSFLPISHCSMPVSKSQVFFDPFPFSIFRPTSSNLRPRRFSAILWIGSLLESGRHWAGAPFLVLLSILPFLHFRGSWILSDNSTNAAMMRGREVDYLVRLIIWRTVVRIHSHATIGIVSQNRITRSRRTKSHTSLSKIKAEEETGSKSWNL